MFKKRGYPDRWYCGYRDFVQTADSLIEKDYKSISILLRIRCFQAKTYDNIENSQLAKLYVTDTIPLKQASPKIEVLSSAKLFARAYGILMSIDPLQHYLLINNQICRKNNKIFLPCDP